MPKSANCTIARKFVAFPSPLICLHMSYRHTHTHTNTYIVKQYVLFRNSKKSPSQLCNTDRHTHTHTHTHTPPMTF